MADREKHFTLVCPKCGSQHIVGVSEVPGLKARASVVRWDCLVCECRVEMGLKPGIVLKEPVKLKGEALKRLRGKGKKENG